MHAYKPTGTNRFTPGFAINTFRGLIMATYTDEDGRVIVERRSSAGTVIGVIIALAVIVVVVLFATGFWSANVTREGELPKVKVDTEGGQLPKVDVNSKKIVVGTTPQTVDVPKVETKKTTIDVPTVGVKN